MQERLEYLRVRGVPTVFNSQTFSVCRVDNDDNKMFSRFTALARRIFVLNFLLGNFK